MEQGYKLFILVLMLFLHLVDDYYLQGILASMKQRKWWVDKIGEDLGKYKEDYLMALTEHAFSWTFMIMLPVMYVKYFTFTPTLLIVFSTNWIIHIIVDNLKANENKINLVQDQLIHACQIVVTWLLFVA